jgi:alpha-L-rhamnosidase
VGENRLGALLADGWYSGAPGIGPRQQFGDRPWLALQLHLRLSTGERLIVRSDGQWRWRPSWILAADPTAGESVDGRQRVADDVEEVGYPVCLDETLPPPRGAQTGPPVRATARVHPVGRAELRTAEFGERRLLYDFGQNLVGRISLRLRTARGASLLVRYAEALDADGRVAEGVTGDAYTARGDEMGEVFEPRFSLHGFQYAEVVLDGIEPAEVLEASAVVVHADLVPAATFDCDHPLLNQLQDNIAWTLRCASQFAPCAGFASGLRLGLTGPAQAVLRTAAFHHDVAAFYRDWLAALVEAQHDDGSLPAVVPPLPGVAALLRDGGGGWSDALVVCAWTLYRSYGDRRLLEAHYGGIRRFVEGLQQRFPDHVRSGARSGARLLGPGAGDGAAAGELSATAYSYYSAKLAARIAGVLGKLDDLERFDAFARAVRAAFRRRFVTPDGRLASDALTGYVLALHLGLLEDAEHRFALDLLARRVETSEGALALDPLVVPFMLQVLSDGGRADLAYRALLRISAPSWLHPVLQGATTVWDETTGARSSLALAGIGEWLFTALAGIDLDADLSDARNAYRRVRVRPQPPLGVSFPDGAPIRRVDAALDTINGRYETNWQITDSGFELALKVPCNCSAQVILPDDTRYEVVAGEHRFTMPFDAAGDGIPILLEVS